MCCSHKKDRPRITDGVDREDLTGFRPPSESERNSISAYASEKLVTLKKLYEFGAYLVVILDMGYIAFVVHCASLHLGFSDRFTVSMIAALLFLFNVGMFWGVYQTGSILTKIMSGKYEVASCKIFYVDMSTDSLKYGYAYIQDEDGQKSVDRFPIDVESARRAKLACEDAESSSCSLEVLLMKCPYRNSSFCGYYEAFTPAKLQNGFSGVLV